MSRYKFNRSHESIHGYKVGCGHWRSVAIQAVAEPEIYHVAEFTLSADARVRVQRPLQISLECSSKSKNRDNLSREAENNLPILSVLGFRYLFLIVMLLISESI